MQVASIEHVEQQLKLAEVKARLTQMATPKFLTLYLCLQFGLLAANFCTNRLFNSPLLSLVQMVLIALFISVIILETTVGQVRVCVFLAFWQGATTTQPSCC